jgi:hypothetical protein
MKKSQIWDILEFHRYLCDTDPQKRSIGMSLLYEFIVENCLAGERDDDEYEEDFTCCFTGTCSPDEKEEN